jgi:hypothetical protein
MGLGAGEKATFMLVREVSVGVVIGVKGSVEFVFGKQDCKLKGG